MNRDVHIYLSALCRRPFPGQPPCFMWVLKAYRDVTASAVGGLSVYLECLTSYGWFKPINYIPFPDFHALFAAVVDHTSVRPLC